MIDPGNPDFTNHPTCIRRPNKRIAPADARAAPKATILTPFYNTGPVFHETAESIFRQTFQEWEWIIVNDASTDPESLRILDHYRSLDDPRIRFIDFSSNAGPSAARNRGVELAATAYIYHLDSDDLIEPTTLEKCFWYLVSHPECPWVNGWSVGFGAEEYLWRRGYHDGAEFLRENLVTGRTMIRKSVHEAIGGYDEDIRAGCEDWAFWLKAAEQGVWGHTIPEYFDWYRRREQHWSRWETIDARERLAEFRSAMALRFPQIFAGSFPNYRPPWPTPFEEFEDTLPATNALRRGPPRLLMILPWLSMGGADKFNLDVVEQLSRRGWEITVATTLPSENPWRPQFEKHCADIFALHSFLRPLHHPLFLRYLIGSRMPDAVLVSGSELAYWILLYLRHHFPETPFIDYCHIEEAYWKNGGYPRYAARAQDHLHRNLVSSRHLADWMAERCGADPAKIRVVHTNIDIERWRPDELERARVRNKAGIAEDTPLLLFTGRLCPQKQPEILVKVARRLRDCGFSFHLIVAGDGEDRPWMESYIKQHDLTDVIRLEGPLRASEVHGWMQAADIFFLPSLWEGIALSLFEAMASGMAVVSANVGGQKDLVTPETGILVERGHEHPNDEIEAYTSVLSALLRDPERTRAMGRAARERVSNHFRLDTMIDNFTAIVDECRGAPPLFPVPSSQTGIDIAVRAVEFFRLEAIADSLWKESLRVRHPDDISPRGIAVVDDFAKDWNHLHRHFPFRLHRWWHAGPPGSLLERLRIAQRHPAYNEGNSMEERLVALTRTRYFRLIMGFRRFRTIRRHLPVIYSRLPAAKDR